MQVALRHFGQVGDHVVAQVVEAELVVGAVGDVGLVGLAAPDGLQVAVAVVGVGVGRVEEERAEIRVGGGRLDDADRDAELMIDRPHPLNAVLGKVVVGGDEVRAAAGERIQVEGQGGDEGLAFAGLHFGDLALMEHHAADHLHVVVAQPERPLGRFAHRGERAREDLLHRVGFDLFELAAQAVDRNLILRAEAGVGLLREESARLGQLVLQRAHRVGDLLAELFRLRGQLRVAHALELVLKRVDLLDDRIHAFDLLLVRVAEDFGYQVLEHTS